MNRSSKLVGFASKSASYCPAVTPSTPAVRALTAGEATLPAAVLPNPERLRVDAPYDYVRNRPAWIRQQARQLGSDYPQGL